MALDNAKNFAKVTVSTGYDDNDTSVVLSSGDGAKLPTVPFNAVWWNSTDYSDPSDDPNVEIVRVTNISTDTLTVTRAQESTSGSTKNTGGKTYKMIAGLTAKTINTDLAIGGSDTHVIFNDGGAYAGDANFVYDKTNDNIKLGAPTLISTAKLNVKVTTGNAYHAFYEGTGGVVVPTLGFKHISDSNGVAFTGDDNGFGFSNIGEGQTLFMKPGYPDAYWKTHGSSAAIFHFQSHDGSGYVDSIIINNGGTFVRRGVEANTAGSGTPNALTITETYKVLTNEGATAKNYHTLPSAEVGIQFTFVVQDADGIRVVANTGDTIRLAGTVSGSAGYTESTTVGDSVTLVAINATEWVATSIIGTWSTT